MKFIDKVGHSTPSGHYSPAVICNNMIFLSGQLSIDPESGEKKFGTIEEETLRILKNIELILKESGSDLNKVIKTTIYIPDISLWDRVNKVYMDFFKDHRPARSVVPTRELHFGFKVEIEVVAAI